MKPSDAAVLNRWLRERNAEAFAQIVQRHARGVYATCCRMLHDAAEAEDITQECFEALATVDRARAPRLLGPWLHGVATRRCLTRQRSESRRKARELVYANAASEPPDPGWAEIYPYIDEAVAALPEELSVPLVAHFFNGQSHTEIARAMGIPRRTIGNRIHKGLELIAVALNKRGIALPAAALAPLLGAGLAEAAEVPATLNASLARLSLAQAAHTPRNSFISAKTLLVGAVLTATVISIVVMLNYVYPSVASAPMQVATRVARPEAPVQAHIDNDARVRKLVGPATAPALARQTDKIDVDDQQATLRFTEYARIQGWIRATKSEAPIADVDVRLRVSAKDAPTEAPAVYSAVSDELGFFAIENISTEGHGTVTAHHPNYLQSEPPELGIAAKGDETVVVPMQPATTVAGRLFDRNGAPVVDGTLSVQELESDHMSTFSPFLSNESKTDEAGRFELLVTLVAGDDALMGIEAVSVTHGKTTFRDTPLRNEGELELRYPQPTSLFGKILRPDETAAAGLTIELRAAHGRDNLESTTDESGRFRFNDLQPALDYAITLLEAGTPLVAALPVDGLIPGAENQWNYTLSAPAVVTGVVRGEVYKRPLANVAVVCIDNQDWSHGVSQYETRTDETGRYRFAISSGAQEIHIAATHAPNQIASHDGEPIRLTPGREVTVNLSLVEPWSMEFRVLDSNRHPLGDVGVRISERIAHVTTNGGLPMTDDNGVVKTNSLTAGSEVRVRFAKRGYAEFEAGPYTGSPGEHLRPEVVLLHAECGMMAVLTDKEGAALTDTNVEITFSHDDNVTLLQSATNSWGEMMVPGNIPATTGILEITASDVSKSPTQTLLYRSTNVQFSPGVILDFGTLAMASTE